MPNALVLEDDMELAWNISVELEALGYSADIASSLGQFKSCVAKRPYGLIVSDIILRDRNEHRMENTLATVFRIKRTQAKCFVIVITGSYRSKGMDGILKLAMQLGADRVLEKPFDMSELTLMVCEAQAN